MVSGDITTLKINVARDLRERFIKLGVDAYGLSHAGVLSQLVDHAEHHGGLKHMQASEVNPVNPVAGSQPDGATKGGTTGADSERGPGRPAKPKKFAWDSTQWEILFWEDFESPADKRLGYWQEGDTTCRWYKRYATSASGTGYDYALAELVIEETGDDPSGNGQRVCVRASGFNSNPTAPNWNVYADEVADGRLLVINAPPGVHRFATEADALAFAVGRNLGRIGEFELAWRR